MVSTLTSIMAMPFYVLPWREEELTPNARAFLAGLLAGTLQTEEGESDLLRTMALTVNSLAQTFEGTCNQIKLPKDISFLSAPSLPGFESIATGAREAGNT